MGPAFDEEGDDKRRLKTVLEEMFVIEKATLGRRQIVIHAGLTMADGPSRRRTVERQALTGF